MTTLQRPGPLVLGIAFASVVGPSAVFADDWTPADEFVLSTEKDYAEIHASVEAGRWRSAVEASDKLIDDLIETVAGEADEWFGRVFVMRALAHAGSGDLAAAEWDWSVAVDVLPEVAGADLSRYGDAASALESLREPRLWVKRCGLTAEADASGTRIQGPVKRKSRKPDYPSRLRLYSQEALIILELVIDETGRPARVETLRGGKTAFEVATFEAVRRWRFKPALRGGDPIACLYTLTVNFDPK